MPWRTWAEKDGAQPLPMLPRWGRRAFAASERRVHGQERLPSRLRTHKVLTLRTASCLLLAFASATVTASGQTTGETAGHDFFHVSLNPNFNGPVSGRLLLFIAPKAADAKDAASVDMNMMSPASVYVVAKEVPHLAPGDSVDIDADDIVFPGLSLAHLRAVIACRPCSMSITTTTIEVASPVTSSARR